MITKTVQIFTELSFNNLYIIYKDNILFNISTYSRLSQWIILSQKVKSDVIKHFNRFEE